MKIFCAIAFAAFLSVPGVSQIRGFPEIPEFEARNANKDVRVCRESQKARILPPEIGRADAATRHLQAMPCDTMVVPKGSRTLVHPNTMLFFRRPSLSCIIKVEGHLVLQGNQDEHVYLSSSIDTLDRFKRVYEPGERMWAGIEVAPEGSLDIQFAIIVGAPTPITAFSEKVRITNSLFKGSSGIVLPDGEVFPMEPTLHSILQLDMADMDQEMADRDQDSMGRAGSAANTARSEEGPSEREKEKVLQGKPAFWTPAMVWTGVALVGAAGAGAGLYLKGRETSGPSGEPAPSGGDVNPLVDPNETLEFPSTGR